MWLTEVATFLRQWPCWKAPVILNRVNSSSETSGPLDADSLVNQLRVVITGLKGSFMSEDGRSVDYKAMQQSSQFESFCQLAGQLQHVSVDGFTQEQLKAFFINIYNSLTIHALVHQAASVKPGCALESPVKIRGFWKLHSYDIGGRVYSLDDIEHGVLRANRGHPALGKCQFSAADPRSSHVVRDLDPRIHFALNCGARSCPPIRIYSDDRIDEQLELATQGFLSQEVELQLGQPRESDQLIISRLFLWYGGDFGADQSAVIAWIVKHMPIQANAKDWRLETIQLKYRDYDWTANQGS